MTLLEGVGKLEMGGLLVGSYQTASELLQVWIYRQERGFDLLVGSTSSGNHPRPHRNIVSHGFESVAELLEALASLDQIYKVSAQELLDLPTTLQKAIPAQMDMLARQLQYAGIQTKDSLELAPKVDLLEFEHNDTAALEDDDIQVLAD
ncbi:MAG: hypothetical protein IVW51_13210 [Thermaceae bacterium]|nr:hypothetical protein [Thermaceae bacterium]